MSVLLVTAATRRARRVGATILLTLGVAIAAASEAGAQSRPAPVTTKAPGSVVPLPPPDSVEIEAIAMVNSQCFISAITCQGNCKKEATNRNGNRNRNDDMSRDEYLDCLAGCARDSDRCRRDTGFRIDQPTQLRPAPARPDEQ